ncbi:polysaccharide pyruvyl transferase family protein [Rossellomorea sp. NPDC071047]|uniref:polysaccharide pyruvyl transferase family protein n=1 Tax=Rossellomorea sp. NPDC071047 TaxID=3390675 RepID=UPI003D062523
MKIELKGVNFINKGAELMLLSVLDRYSETKEINFTVSHLTGMYHKRAKLGLYQKFWINKINNQGNILINNLIPKKFEQVFGITPINTIDAVFDVSGFAYSDQWGTAPIKEMAQYYKNMKKLGKTIILLPQAFGPFELKNNKKYMKEIIDNVDLIFARDEVSYKYLRQISESDKIQMAPDFTNLIRPKLPNDVDKFKGKTCIIPNYRMIDKGDDPNKYIDSLCLIVKNLQKNNAPFFFLIHDTGKDLELAQQVMRKTGSKFPIYTEDDALVIKGIISCCNLVISSRFHGLVSSLSQAIPSIAIGWSHKYEMLFNDYNCNEMIYSTDEDLSELELKINDSLNNSFAKSINVKLEEASIVQKEKSLKMWNQVEDLLNIKTVKEMVK